MSRVGAALLVLFMAQPALAGGTPLALQVKLFFKIASYDEKLPDGELRIGIVYPESQESHGKEALAAFRALQQLKINGRSFTISEVSFNSAADLQARTARTQFYGFFVTAVTMEQVKSTIRAVAKQHGIFTFAQDASLVNAGIAAGVEENGTRRTIILNLPALIEAGRQFPAGFLDVCKVIH